MSKYRIAPGEYLIISVDGIETRVNEKPTLERLYAAIGCDCIDTVSLIKGPDGRAELVMVVDDEGMLKDSPLNTVATALYYALTRRVKHPDDLIAVISQTGHGIYGVAVLVNDEDFQE